MIFGLTTQQQRDKLQRELSKRYGKLPYYAWFPVQIDQDGRWVWLETVLRENIRIEQHVNFWYSGGIDAIKYPKYVYHFKDTK